MICAELENLMRQQLLHTSSPFPDSLRVPVAALPNLACDGRDGDGDGNDDNDAAAAAADDDEDGGGDIW